MKQRYLWALVLSATLITPAVAQQTVSPAKGQSPEQQQNDEVDCYNWAISQTGFDPAAQAPPQQVSAPPTTATGTTPGAGARGAARGAVVGEIVGADTGNAAVAGAAASRSRSRRGNRAAEDQAEQAQQQQQAATQQQQDSFDQARTTCLEGRGYSVK